MIGAMVRCSPLVLLFDAPDRSLQDFGTMIIAHIISLFLERGLKNRLTYESACFLRLMQKTMRLTRL